MITSVDVRGADQQPSGARGRPPQAAIVVTALGVTLAMVACGGQDDGGRARGGAEPTSAENTEGGPALSSAPDERAGGRAVSVSDVSGLEASAFTTGSVVFVPEERADALAAAAGVGSSEPGALRHAGFSLDDASLAELRGTATPLDRRGSFPVDVPAGRYVVCLADVFADHSPGPPYSVVGCDHVELPATAELLVSFGEGGVEATLD